MYRLELKTGGGGGDGKGEIETRVNSKVVNVLAMYYDRALFTEKLVNFYSTVQLFVNFIYLFTYVS